MKRVKTLEWLTFHCPKYVCVSKCFKNCRFNARKEDGQTERQAKNNFLNRLASVS